jgi:O-antigen ligase
LPENPRQDALQSMPNRFVSPMSVAGTQPMTGYNARRISNVRSRTQNMFRRAAFFFLWVLACVVPWENAVVIPGFGTLSRVIGIPAFGMALLAVLETGTLRTLSLQHIIMLFFLMWASLTYFWSFAPSETVTSIYTFIQLFMMVWLIWEFAQTRKQQLLLLRAYSVGAMVSAIATLVGYAHGTGLQSGRYSGAGFNPGDLGLILALSIPTSLYLALRERRKILIWLDGSATVLAFCALVLTASRGSLVACLPTLLMFPFLFPKMRVGQNLLVLVFIVLAGVGSWLYIPESSWSRLSTIGSEISSGTLNERTMIWQLGWQVFGQAPFQGIGLRAYAPTVEHSLGLATNPGNEIGGPMASLVAHNTFFSVLVEQGVIGFALFCALLLTLILAAWKLPSIERLFWLCILLTWAIGALALTWEDRKPTWFFFGLLMAAAAAKLVPEAHSFGAQAPPGQRSEFHTRSLVPAGISRSQGLS